VQLNADARVKKEAFQARRWSPAESAASRALFHAAMSRPVEARALVAEARKTEPSHHLTFEVEGTLLEREKQLDGARDAYGRAVDAGSTSFYAYYRFATLTNRPGAAPDSLAKAERSLETATKLNPNSSFSFLMLGELRTQLNRAADALVPLERAVALEPDSVRNRVSFARALALVDRRDDAQRVAQAALTISTTDADRRAAQQLIDMLQKIGSGPIRPPAR
jgi:tetratricopeptide (TPR) repeat protein